MNNQLTTLDEAALLNSPFDVENLKSLDKNSISRIQIVSFKRNRALKSVQDSQRKVRIIIVSLLIKIFSEFTPSNRDRLQRLKKIIYSSKLQKITEEKGIVRQILLKAVALQFKKIKYGYSVQMDIIKMFNCSPFIDQIILSALREQNPLLFESDCEVSSWLDRQLSIKIIWNEQYVEQQREQQLFLAGLGQEFHASKDCKCLQCDYKTFQQYLRFSSHEHFQNMDDQVSQIYDRNTKSLFNYPLSPEQKSQKKSEIYPQGYYASVETMSPSTKTSMGQKQNKHTLIETPEIKLFDTPIQRPLQEKNNERKTNRVSKNIKLADNTIKFRRSNQNKEERPSFWFLCCGNI